MAGVARRRLDAELVRRSMARSREHAAQLIAAGRVTVGGTTATKAATQVETSAALVVLKDDSDRHAAVLALQLNNASRTIRLSRLAISLGAYPGRVRLYAPPLPVDGELEGLVEGAHLDADFDDFLRWAELQLEAIEDNQNGDHPYDRDWARLQSRDIEAARDAGVMLVADGDEIAIRRLRLRRGRRHPLFLLLDLPEDGVEATAHDLDIRHLAERGEELVGGIRARVELVTPP